MLKLIRITEKDTQVVYLTATLPLAQQPYFLQLTSLNKQSLTLCRDACTARPNITYSVVKHNRANLELVLKRLVAQKRARYGPAAQIIVYCPTKEQT